MSEQPQPMRETDQDRRQELTELEWEAGRRQLNQEEQRRLETLRQGQGQLLESAEESMERQGSHKFVEMKGDDSPV